MMETNQLKEQWPAIKERARREYPELTDEDLAYEIGKEGELLKRLQEKMHKNEEEIQDWLHFMG